MENKKGLQQSSSKTLLNQFTVADPDHVLLQKFKESDGTADKIIADLSDWINQGNNPLEFLEIIPAIIDNTSASKAHLIHLNLLSSALKSYHPLPPIILQIIGIHWSTSELSAASNPFPENYPSEIEKNLANQILTAVPEYFAPLLFFKLQLHLFFDQSQSIVYIQRLLDQRDFEMAAIHILQLELKNEFRNQLYTIANQLASSGKVTTVKQLLEGEDEMRWDLLNATKDKRRAQSLVNAFDFDIKDKRLIELRHNIIKSQLKFQFTRNKETYQKKGHPFMYLLNQLLDVVDDDSQTLTFMVQTLAQLNHFNEAKWIQETYKLDMDNYLTPKQKEVLDALKFEQKYIAKVDERFGPVTKPYDKQFQLPDDVKINVIDTEEKIKLMDQLLEEPLIGIDSEWRMMLYDDKEQVLPLIQISGQKEVFLVDTLTLGQNKQLDQKLKQIFTNKNSTILGFGFNSDLVEFCRKFPQMEFFHEITNFVDIQDYYSFVFKVEYQAGLLNVTSHLIGKQLCKFRQISNWERRPLLPSQEHYGSLDAWLLPILFAKLQAQDKSGALAYKAKTLTLNNNSKYDLMSNQDDLNGQKWAQKTWMKVCVNNRWRLIDSIVNQSVKKTKKEIDKLNKIEMGQEEQENGGQQ